MGRADDVTGDGAVQRPVPSHGDAACVIGRGDIGADRSQFRLTSNSNGDDSNSLSLSLHFPSPSRPITQTARRAHISAIALSAPLDINNHLPASSRQHSCSLAAGRAGKRLSPSGRFRVSQRRGSVATSAAPLLPRAAATRQRAASG